MLAYEHQPNTMRSVFFSAIGRHESNELPLMAPVEGCGVCLEGLLGEDPALEGAVCGPLVDRAGLMATSFPPPPFGPGENKHSLPFIPSYSG